MVYQSWSMKSHTFLLPLAHLVGVKVQGGSTRAVAECRSMAKIAAAENAAAENRGFWGAKSVSYENPVGNIF